MKSKRDQLAGLQVLRGIAALMVVVDHALLDLVAKGGVDLHSESISHAFGYVGVATFFVISGFIMMHSFGDRFAESGSPLVFILHRIRRIVPLYWIITILYFAKLAIEGRGPTGEELFKSLLFVPYLNADQAIRPVLGQGWTLNFEMFFYLAFALVLFLPRKIGVATLSLAFLALAGTGFLFDWDLSTNAFLKMIGDPLVLFFIGGILVRTVEPIRLDRFSSYAAGIPLALLLIAALVLLLVVPGAGLFTLPFIAGSIFLSVNWLRAGPQSWVSRVMFELGNASYSIYLTHTLLIGVSAQVWAKLALPDGVWPVFLLATLVGSAILGVIVYKVIEGPIDQQLRKLTRSSSARAAVPLKK